MISADANCRTVCLGLSALAGLVALWLTSGAFPFVGAVMFAGAFGAIFNLSLSRIACEDKGMAQAVRRVLGIAPDMAEDAAEAAPVAEGETPRANHDKTAPQAPGKGRAT
jgi:hypothetical protein